MRLSLTLLGLLLLVAGGFGVAGALESGPGAARFSATASHFSWLYRPDYVAFTARVTNVGGLASTFLCTSQIFGVSGVDDTNVLVPLAPGATTEVADVAVLVPTHRQRDPLKVLASHIRPICEAVPPIHRITVH